MMSNELLMLWAWTRATAHSTASRRVRDERGAGALEWVIIVGLVAAIAIAAGIIVRQKVMDSANSIPTG